MFKKFGREAERIGKQVKREAARVENDVKTAVAAINEAHHPAEPENNDANQNQGNRPGF